MTQGSIADRRRDPPTTQLPQSRQSLLPGSKTSPVCQWPPHPIPAGFTGNASQWGPSSASVGLVSPDPAA